MTIVSPSVLDSSYFQDGQAAGSIVPLNVRVLNNSLAGVAASPSGTQTGSTYTAVLADRGTVVEMNSSSAQTFSIPTNASVAFDVGTVIEIYQMGTGQVTIAAVTPATTTLRSSTATFATRAQYSSATVRKRATDEWVVAGDLS